MRGATAVGLAATLLARISIHAPRAGSDAPAHLLQQPDFYFNPRSPCGERPSPHMRRFRPRYFNPRSPCGERRDMQPTDTLIDTFQSTLPVRGATRATRRPRNGVRISIHAPRAGSDARGIFHKGDTLISIHAPRAGSDRHGSLRARNPCISIHAPRAGSDARYYDSRPWNLISIHAPRAGSDGGGDVRPCFITYFNPRSPCGERPSAQRSPTGKPVFQSTLPVRGATINRFTSYAFESISIHAPRAGSDPAFFVNISALQFQSTLPVRGATWQ